MKLNRRKHWNCEGILWWFKELVDGECFRRLALKDQAEKKK